MVAVVGLAIGLAGSIALASLMGSLLFGVTARDPVTFATVPVVVIVAALASMVPARSATKLSVRETIAYE